MSLTDINIKGSYYNQVDRVVEDFLIPVLKESVEYDRAVGFFSSSSLLSITVGIKHIVQKRGRIKIICSPKLSDDDFEAVKKGYELRGVIENALSREFKDAEDEFEKERLNIVSHLISEGIMDIKIAFMKSMNPNAIFHPKVGIVKDEEGNFIAFSGSMNESRNAFYENEESIDVFKSYGSEYERALEKKNYFDELWSDGGSNVEVLDFPVALYKKIEAYRTDDVDYDIDSKEIRRRKMASKNPVVPSDVKIRDYQENAYKNWKNNEFIGIYDMATGTGKTYAALYSIVNVLKEKNNNLGIVICCPYQHLVNQWSEDLTKFNIKYIAGFSGSPQKKWKEQLSKGLKEL